MQRTALCPQVFSIKSTGGSRWCPWGVKGALWSLMLANDWIRYARTARMKW